MSTASRLVFVGLAATVYMQPTGRQPTGRATDAIKRHNPLQVGENTRSPRASGLLSEETLPGELALPMPPDVVVVPRSAGRPIKLNQAPSIPTNRDAIGRQLQKELKRVGCYAGELHGVWTASTRRAMREFTDRVNAMLPIAEPDIILLTLVRAHAEKVCGVPCPAGQSLHTAGQCLPDALLALNGGVKTAARPIERSSSIITAWTATPTVVDERGAVGQIDPTPSAAEVPALEPPRRHAKARREQPRSREQRRWAQQFFKQYDRFGFN